MYIHVHQDMKCSKCGAINHTEHVTRNNQTFIRCVKCNHEKLLWTMTTNSSTDPGTSNYQSPPLIETF